MPCCRSCYDDDSSHKKDSAWAWIVCAAASTNLAFTLGLIFSFGVLLPVFMDYFKESRGNTGKGLNCGKSLGFNKTQINSCILSVAAWPFTYDQPIIVRHDVNLMTVDTPMKVFLYKIPDVFNR